MSLPSNIKWLATLKREVPEFLSTLQGEQPGFFHYSLTGDRFDETEGWGLGNTVYATKIYHTLGALEDLPATQRDAMRSFICGFQDTNGQLYDPIIERSDSTIRTILSAVKHRQFSHLDLENKGRKRAETRQAFTALSLLNARPNFPCLEIPYSENKVRSFLSEFDWTLPWDAGSHFSHLVYFYDRNQSLFNIFTAGADGLIDQAVDWVSALESPETGSWYEGDNISEQQRINGAMKVLSGLVAVDRLEVQHPEPLVDTVLSHMEFKNACDIVDAVYVLWVISERLYIDYRINDVREFCRQWLDTCSKHYYPDIGGFSFYPNSANQNYYGVSITEGRNEPDIHGTALLVWGIMMAAEILGLNNELQFNPHET